jgi:hypothetical protein
MGNEVLHLARGANVTWEVAGMSPAGQSRVETADPSLGFSADLCDRFLHHFIHGSANLVIGLGDFAGREVALDLPEDVLVARLLEIGRDDVADVGVKIGPALAQKPPRPGAEHPVPSRLRLKAKLGIVRELLLEGVFALIESGHLRHSWLAAFGITAAHP